MGHYAMIGVATLFAALAALFIAISFATDHWLETRVDRKDLQLIVQQVGVCMCGACVCVLCVWCVSGCCGCGYVDAKCLCVGGVYGCLGEWSRR